MSIRTAQEQIDTRALEIATRADQKVEALRDDMHQTRGDVAEMRKENAQQHREARETLSKGLGRVHQRMDRAQAWLIGCMFTIILGLAGIAWGVLTGT